MPAQIKRRRSLLQYSVKAAAFFGYDLYKIKSPVSSYSDAICFCANIVTYGGYAKVSWSVPSGLYGKVGLYPGYFQVISRLYEFYNHTNMVIFRLFPIDSCTDMVIFRLYPIVCCRNKAFFNRKSPHFSMRAFCIYLLIQSGFNIKKYLPHQGRIQFHGCISVSSGSFPNFSNKEIYNHILRDFFLRFTAGNSFLLCSLFHKLFWRMIVILPELTIHPMYHFILLYEIF